MEKNKYIKKLYLLLVFFFAFSGAYSQTCFDQLSIDYTKNGISSDFKNFINSDPDGFFVYQKVYQKSLAVRTNIDVLKFQKRIKSSSLRKIGDKIAEVLSDDEIIDFSSKFKNASDADLVLISNKLETIDVWKKYKDLQNVGISKVSDLIAYERVWKQTVINVSFDNFYSKTLDQIKASFNKKGDHLFAVELFEAWKKGKGNHVELQNIYTKYGLNPSVEYPPCEGVWGIEKRPSSTEEVFDRFQKHETIGGSYVGICPPNSSFTIESRALKENYSEIVANNENYFYFKFKFKSTYTSNLEIGEAIPWFGKQGGAIQAKTSQKLNNIEDQLEIVEKRKLENGQWVKIVTGVGKLDFAAMDLLATLRHVKFRDLADLARRDIVGLHDAIEFYKLRITRAIGNRSFQFPIGKTLDEVEDIVILAERSHSTVPGVKVIEYRVPSTDGKFSQRVMNAQGEMVDVNKGYTTGGTKGKSTTEDYIKTIYESDIWTDAKLEKALKAALQDVANRNGGNIPYKFNGVTSEGYKIEGYFKDGKVSTFYFQPN